MSVFRLGLSLSEKRASILRSASGTCREFPCRGSAPAVARDLISPDLAPVQGSLVTALPINILPLRALSWLAGHSRGLDCGRSRSRSRADRLGDCPDETDELTSHRRNGDVLELAPPEQRSVTLIEAGLRLPGNLANRLRHRLDLDLFVFAQPRRKLITPGTLDQHASHPPIAGLGDRTTLDLVAGGVLACHDPDIGHQLTGGSKPREVADFGHDGRRRHDVETAHRH